MNILTDKIQSIVDYVYKLCYENNTSYNISYLHIMKSAAGKHTCDDESEEMLGIVFSNLIYSFGTGYCTNLNLIVLTSLINAKNTDLMVC